MATYLVTGAANAANLDPVRDRIRLAITHMLRGRKVPVYGDGLQPGPTTTAAT